MASFVRSCNGFPSGRTDTEPVQARREFPPMQKYGFRTDGQADGLRFVLPELPIFDEPDGDHSDLASFEQLTPLPWSAHWPRARNTCSTMSRTQPRPPGYSET